MSFFVYKRKTVIFGPTKHCHSSSLIYDNPILILFNLVLQQTTSYSSVTCSQHLSPHLSAPPLLLAKLFHHRRSTQNQGEYSFLQQPPPLNLHARRCTRFLELQPWLLIRRLRRPTDDLPGFPTLMWRRLIGRFLRRMSSWRFMLRIPLFWILRSELAMIEACSGNSNRWRWRDFLVTVVGNGKRTSVGSELKLHICICILRLSYYLIAFEYLTNYDH